MMYTAYKLNKQGDNIQPWSTPFPVLNQYIVPGPVLTELTLEGVLIFPQRGLDLKLQAY